MGEDGESRWSRLPLRTGDDPFVRTHTALLRDSRGLLRGWVDNLLGRLRCHGGDGGITRLVYTEAWRGAMAEIEDWFAAAGLEVRADAVGSRFGRLRGESPEVVLCGSHVDSVVAGGSFDGVAGVAISACAVRWLAQVAGTPRRTVEVWAGCEEESSRFPANFWGGRAMLGLIEEGEAERLRDRDGVTIADAMRACGLDAGRIGEARRTDLATFIEPHIEQGPLLDREGVTIGVVDRIVGVRQLEVDYIGSTGHAGTVPMTGRRDAMPAAAELVLTVERIVAERGAPAVATAGSLRALPGGFNQIAGRACLGLDLRHAEESLLDLLEVRVREAAAEIASRRSLELSVRRRLAQGAITLNSGIRRLLEEACLDLGIRWRRMPSHAGHDAQLIARHLPAAMLFVPSLGGHSHRPEEFTSADDLAAAVQVLAHALLRLAF